eukprot:11145349-Karenia_brevis.AAC.1
MQSGALLLVVISFCAAIPACKKGQQWQCVARSVDELQSGALSPDAISFNAAISAEGGADNEL